MSTPAVEIRQIEIAPRPGDAAASFIERACRIATDYRCRVVFTFNEEEGAVMPGDDPAETVRRVFPYLFKRE